MYNKSVQCDCSEQGGGFPSDQWRPEIMKTEHRRRGPSFDNVSLKYLDLGLERHLTHFWKDEGIENVWNAAGRLITISDTKGRPQKSYITMGCWLAFLRLFKSQSSQMACLFCARFTKMLLEILLCKRRPSSHKAATLFPSNLCGVTDEMDSRRASLVCQKVH